MPPAPVSHEVRLKRITFAPALEIRSCSAKIDGYVKPSSGTRIFPFSVRAEFDPEKRLWGVLVPTLRWTIPVPEPFFFQINVESICKVLASAFRLIWMQPIPSPNEAGAQIRIGHTIMTEEECRDSFMIVRGDIMAVYHLEWIELWPAIENRLAHDREFWVSGFSRDDALNAVKTLRQVFPWEWVRKRYQEGRKMNRKVGMWEEMQADQGFPAYILARTALSSVCKDPGWNYLISLAQACKRLGALRNGVSLVAKIASEPGYIHQVTFSDYLLGRGMLAELEPATGSGSAKHDLTARVGEALIDIEIKALTSSVPSLAISKEINDKCRKLPLNPQKPVVFFVILFDKSTTADKKTWQDQLNSISTEVFDGTGGVSFVVIGRIFIDSAGGPIKWSFDKFLNNETATHPVSDTLMHKIFEPNWTRINYPALPIGLSYNFTKHENK